jgi:glycosyltransferase involved in cell wall biosynthesis
MNNPPLVSIICTSYNHEKYIAQALEGFVMQKTTFPFEIIVHDDASIDNTASIIRNYEIKYPELFVAIYQSENQYSKCDYTIDKTVFGIVRGKYIALCEGDDYWVDPYKLQKQVSFLEENQDYGLIYSKVRVFYQKNSKFLKRSYGKSFSSVEQLFISNYIPTPTAMLRTSLYNKYLEEINPFEKMWLMGDYPLWMYIVSVSKVKYMENSFSVYRLLENSAAHSDDSKNEILFIESYRDIKLYFMKRLGYEHLEKRIWAHFFSGKAHIYLFKNEKKLHELMKEMDDIKLNYYKICLIRFLIKFWFLRKLLKLYWSHR